jgi:hypothetical protein
MCYSQYSLLMKKNPENVILLKGVFLVDAHFLKKAKYLSVYTANSFL